MMSDAELVTVITLRDVLQKAITFGGYVAGLSVHATALCDVLNVHPLNLDELLKAMDAWSAAAKVVATEGVKFDAAVVQMWRDYEAAEAKAVAVRAAAVRAIMN